MFIRGIAVFFALALLTPGGAKAQKIIAHRGASHDAPENTLAAFDLAWEQGADGIEGDFYLSADGHIVCIHDATTKRTAGVELAVAKSTLAELRRLDVGRFKGEKWAGQRIATLEEVLARVPEGKCIFIEIKCGPEILKPLAKTLAACKLDPSSAQVICFQKDVIAQVKRTIPNINAYWLTSYKKGKTGRFTPTPKSVLSTLLSIKADGLDTNANLSVVDAAMVKSLRDANLAVHAWTVNDAPTARRLRDLGVDSITTDRPDYIRRALEKNP
jgi:glycerophosphoryl diester phosphodiesterase